MQRYDYLKAIAPHAADALAVCTGWAAREWWALRPSEGNLKPAPSDWSHRSPLG